MSKAAQNAVIFAVVGIQVGVAVLGMGGFAFFFAHDALIALAVVGLVMFIVSLFSDGNLSTRELLTAALGAYRAHPGRGGAAVRLRSMRPTASAPPASFPVCTERHGRQ
jgi:hypothetical protein